MAVFKMHKELFKLLAEKSVAWYPGVKYLLANGRAFSYLYMVRPQLNRGQGVTLEP